MTASQRLFDSSVKHQIYLRRFAGGLVAALIALLEKSDRSVVRAVRERLAAGRINLRSPAWRKWMVGIFSDRAEVIRALQDDLVQRLREFSEAEIDSETKRLQDVVPEDVTLAVPPIGLTWSRSFQAPLLGAFLVDWFRDVIARDRSSLRAAVQIGVAQGDALGAALHRLAGTKEADFRDGALATTRRQVESIIRTSVDHTSNGARVAVWDANPDTVIAMRWTSILDNRTTPICRARDGKMAPIGRNPLPPGASPLIPPDARPPAHWNCRSVMTPVLVGDPIPPETTYSTWLAAQPAAFQDDVLGPARGKLFRSGTLGLDAFVDSTGRTLTLEELRQL